MRLTAGYSPVHHVPVFFEQTGVQVHQDISGGFSAFSVHLDRDRSLLVCFALRTVLRSHHGMHSELSQGVQLVLSALSELIHCRGNSTTNAVIDVPLAGKNYFIFLLALH